MTEQNAIKEAERLANLFGTTHHVVEIINEFWPVAHSYQGNGFIIYTARPDYMYTRRSK